MENLEQLQQRLRNVQNVLAATTKAQAATRAALDGFQRQLAEAEAERQTIIKLLQSQLAAAEKRMEFQSTLVRTVKLRFEMGDGQFEDVVKAEQPLADTEAKIQQLKLLLEHYRGLGSDQAEPKELPTNAPEENKTGIIPAKTDAELTVIIELLKVNLEASRRQLDQAQRDLERTKSLHEENLISTEKLEHAQ